MFTLAISYGWMASLTWWTWVSVNSGSWCWTGRPGVLQFTGLQRVRHDWATDLIWSDLMQYCSLQQWTLLLSPVTSTTGHCCHFGSVSPFFLELFLHSSPAAYWARTNLGFYLKDRKSSIFLLFHTVHRFVKARILKWFAIACSSGQCFLRTFHHDPSILGGST